MERLTTVHLVSPIQAVSLSVTQEFLLDAAFPISTAVLTAFGLFPAVDLIRIILTVGFSITHLISRDAHPAMAALELT